MIAPAAAIPATIHATALAIGRFGVLLRGPSGAGKSALALALLERAEQQGRFARLIADDRVIVTVRSGRAIASPPTTLAGRMEIRGRGIVIVPHEPAAVLSLVVDIVETTAFPRLPDGPQEHAEIDGICLPRQYVTGYSPSDCRLVDVALAALVSPAL